MRSLFRYFALKYEDMVGKPEETVNELYKALDMPIDNVSIEALKNHLTKDAEKGFLSTFRGPDHDIDKWKHKLKMEEIRMIEKECAAFMERFGYQTFGS